MKVTNISSNPIYLADLRLTRESQSEGRPSEDRYLATGESCYLPNTSEVLRSAIKGSLRKWRDTGVVTLEDQDTLDANGGDDTVVLTHNYGIPPVVYVLKQVADTWVDATGTVDVVHNADFTTVSITNTLLLAQTLFIRML